MHALNTTHCMKAWQSAGSGFFIPDDMNALQSCCVHVIHVGRGEFGLSRRIVAPEQETVSGFESRLSNVIMNCISCQCTHICIMIPICGCGLVWSRSPPRHGGNAGSNPAIRTHGNNVFNYRQVSDEAAF